MLTAVTGNINYLCCIILKYMSNVDYHLTDSELLNKYGFKPCASYGSMAMNMIALYCARHGYHIEIYQEGEKQKEYLEQLACKLPRNPRMLLQSSVLDLASSFYADQFAWIDYIVRTVPKEEFQYEYPLVLSALCDQLHIKCDDLALIKFEWAVKLYLSDVLPADEPYYAGAGGVLEDLILSELIYSSDVPTIGIQSDESNPSQTTDDSDLDYYFDCSPRDIEVLQERDFNHELMHGLDRCYERGGFYAIFHYDTKFSTDTIKHELIKSMLEQGFVKEVITDGIRNIVVVGIYGGYDSVAFKYFDGQNIVEHEELRDPVPYPIIAGYGYNLYPSHYIEEKASDGKELVAIGDLCEIDDDSMQELIEDSRTYNSLPRYYFSNDIQEVLANAESPKNYRVSLLASIYKGSHLHINSQGEMFLNNLPGYYMCPEDAGCALRIKDDLISSDYLAYVLHHNKLLAKFISTKPTTEILLKRKIAILKDRDSQDALMADFYEKTSSIVSSDSIYRVAIVDSVSSEEQDFMSWGLETCCYCHIQGDEGLLFAIGKGDYTPDAIIVDAMVDSIRDRYKGLRELLAVVRKQEIPVFVYTDVPECYLQDDLYDEEYKYIVNGRYFSKSDDGSLEKLVKTLREELDGEDNVIAKIKGQYAREFEAANWLDSKFPKLNTASALTYALTQPNKSFTTLRGVLNRLYRLVFDEIRRGFSSDQVKNIGMLPALLRDGSFIDKDQAIYIVHGNIMPLPLAVALRYASDIANGAVHEEDVVKMDVKGYLSLLRSENLAHTLIRIIMDFILWLKEVNFEFDGYCTAEDVNMLHDVCWSGILSQGNNTEEYYCETSDAGKVHVNLRLKKDPIYLGKEIVITKVKREIKYRRKYQWVTYTWEYKK